MTVIESIENMIRPGTSRGLDFITLEELQKRTGITPREVVKFALSEMLCNSLDTDATKIDINVEIEGPFYKLTIKDNGTKKLTLKDFKLILDFENKASSKRGFLRVSRGYLGNALKCIFGYSYALAESKNLEPPKTTVKSGSRHYRITLKPDRIREVIEPKIAVSEGTNDQSTTFIVKLPADYSNEPFNDRPHPSNPSVLKGLVLATSLVNPSRRISYNIFNIEQGTLGTTQEGKTIRQETSALWYTQKQFQSLFNDFLKARPETKLGEIIALFRGFTGKKVISEILQELNSPNHDSALNASMQFFPATPIKDVSRRKLSQLFAVMKARAKPIGKRSIPSVLGCVGKENFEKLCEQHGWQRLRYVKMPATRIECPRDYPSNSRCSNLDHVEFPYLIELAVFDRQQDGEGLKVYQCVNFMASMEDVFSKIFNITYRLGRVGITQETPVTVIAHLVCPVLKWLNYGKSGLDE